MHHALTPPGSLAPQALITSSRPPGLAVREGQGRTGPSAKASHLTSSLRAIPGCHLLLAMHHSRTMACCSITSNVRRLRSSSAFTRTQLLCARALLSNCMPQAGPLVVSRRAVSQPQNAYAVQAFIQVPWVCAPPLRQSRRAHTLFLMGPTNTFGAKPRPDKLSMIIYLP